MIIKRIVPLDAANWSDLVELFGPDSACGGCWCMWWRTTKVDYRWGNANRKALRALVDSGAPTGLLAYAGDPDTDHDEVAGWCAVAPRAQYPRLMNSAGWRGRGDDEGRWAVPCFFVRPGHRRRGLTDDLLAAACEHSRAHGAIAVEGYPLTRHSSPSEMFVGTKALFARHGFVVVREPTNRRAVMERSFEAKA